MSTLRSLARHRRALAATGTLLALTSLAACGGDDDGDTAADAGKPASSSSASATPTADATPAEESSEPAAPAAGEAMESDEFLEVFSAATEQATSANVTIDQSAAGLKGGGVVDYASDPVKMQMSLTIAAAGEVEMRLVDNVMYMKLPMLGDKFIAFDLDDPSNPLGGSFTDFLDPSTMLAAFGKGIESATYVGEEDVKGEPMDHYTVVSDPSAMLGDIELPEGTPEIDLPDTQTIDVWIDGDGFFRKLLTDLGKLGTNTMTFEDWGTDVSVEAPPADEITTMPGAPAA